MFVIETFGLKETESAFRTAFTPLSMQSLMRALGRRVEDQTRRRIASEHRSPDGKNWPALAARTIAMKGHSRPLFNTGDMIGSLQTQASTFRSTVSTGVHYAGYQQFGTKRNPRGSPIPPRPFMGVSDSNELDLEKVSSDFVLRQFTRGRG
jgi:phage virion morphogenesis protein